MNYAESADQFSEYCQQTTLCGPQLLRRVQLSVTPWTVTRQAPLSVGFSRQNTGVGCHALLQRIFPTRESNPVLLHCRQILYQLSHQENNIKSSDP